MRHRQPVRIRKSRDVSLRQTCFYRICDQLKRCSPAHRAFGIYINEPESIHLYIEHGDSGCPSTFAEVPTFMVILTLGSTGERETARARNVTCIPMEKARRDLNASKAVFLPDVLQSLQPFP